MPKQKISIILHAINNNKDTLKDIKNRIIDKSVTFDEIACVLASINRQKHKKQ